MEDFKDIKEIIARLMLLPENTSGILFVKSGAIRRSDLHFLNPNDWPKGINIKIVPCPDPYSNVKFFQNETSS